MARIERLEDRCLLSTIQWANEGSPGSDTDRFNDVFGADAELARDVVRAAIDHWERVIVDFNYPGGGNTYQMTLSMRASGTDRGGIAGVSHYNSADQPDRGTIDLGRGNDENGNGLGDGGGWYIDPFPNDWAEFDWQTINVFAGVNIHQTDPMPERLSDFYSVVVHEMGHLLGIAGGSHGFNDLSTNTGVADPEGGTLYVFNGPSIDHLVTSTNGGSEGGSATHTAHTRPGGITLNYGGRTYQSAEDMMNQASPFSWTRRLIPDTVALILHDAYGYTITMPQTFGTFHAMLDESTGEVIVRGGDGASNDVITIDESGGDLVVSVDLGNDVPGTGALPGAGDLPAFVSRFPLTDISSIRVEAGDGDDTIRVYALPAGLSSVSIDGEEGNDVLDVGSPGGNVGFVHGSLSFTGGTGTDTLNFNDAAGDFPPPYTYDVNGHSVQRSSGPTVNYFSSDQVHLYGRGGGNTININESPSTPIHVHAGGGNDTINFCADDHIFSLVSLVTVDGEGGTDQIHVYDDSYTGDSADYTITPSSLSERASTFDYSNVEGLTLNAGSGESDFHIPQVSVPTTINTGTGEDNIYFADDDHVFSLAEQVTVNNIGTTVDDVWLYDDLYSGGGNYRITNTTVSEGSNTVAYSGWLDIYVEGGSGDSSFIVESTTSEMYAHLHGNDGDDTFEISPTNRQFAIGGRSPILYGDGGDDELFVYDDALIDTSFFPSSAAYVMTDSPWGGSIKETVFGSTVTYTDTLERVTLHGANEQNFQTGQPGLAAYEIDQTIPADRTLTIKAASAAMMHNLFVLGGDDHTLASIEGTLNINGGAVSVDSLTIRDDNNTSPAAYTFSGAAFKNSTGTLNHTSVEGLTLHGGSGGNTIALNDLAIVPTLNLNTGTGSDSVAVNTDDHIWSAGPALTIAGQAGVDMLTVHDDQYNAMAVYNVASGKLDRDGVSGTTIDHSGLEGLTLNAGLNADQILVMDLISMPLTLNAGGGDDAFVFNGDDHVWAQSRPVSLDGQAGTDTVTVYDDLYANGEDYQVNSDYLGMDGSATSRISHARVEDVTLMTGGGADTFETYNIDASLAINVDSGGGSDLFHLICVPAATAFGAVTIHAGEDDDEFRVGEATWFDGLSPTVHGEGGTDRLLIFDDGRPLDSPNYSVTDSAVSAVLADASVHYDTIESITLDTSNQDDHVKIDSAIAGTPVTINGNGGNDLFEVNPGTQVFALGSPVTVHGNSGSHDQLLVHDESFNFDGLTYTVDSSSVTDGLSTVHYDGLESATLNTGGGAATLDVNGTAAGTTIYLNAGAGADRISVFETNPSGPVYVDGGPTDLDTVSVGTGVPGSTAEARFALPQNLTLLEISEGGVLTFEQDAGVVVSTEELLIDPTGAIAPVLDIADGGIIVDYPDAATPLAALADQIADARNFYPGTPWTGPGISSSLAIDDPNGYAVGIAEATDVLLSGGSFLGAAIPPGMEAVLIRATLIGDANLDGDVDVWQFDGGGDAQILSENLGMTTGATWANGDFNYDGDVDVWQFDGGGDAQLLSENLGTSLDLAFDQATIDRNASESLHAVLDWRLQDESMRSRPAKRKDIETTVDLLLAVGLV